MGEFGTSVLSLPRMPPPRTGISHLGPRDFSSELTRNTPSPHIHPDIGASLGELYPGLDWCVETTAVFAEDTVSFISADLMVRPHRPTHGPRPMDFWIVYSTRSSPGLGTFNAIVIHCNFHDLVLGIRV